MFQNDAIFFAYLMNFFSQKTIDQIFPFLIYFSHLCKISNQKKDDYECVFEFFQSHCHKS